MTISTVSETNGQGQKISLTNVKIFNGEGIVEPIWPVVIDGKFISSDPTGATAIDCTGYTLIPGLIDAHVHVHDLEDLALLSKYGVTTGLDMANGNPALFGSFRGGRGIADIRSAGKPATSKGSRVSKMPIFPKEILVSTPDEAEPFVCARRSEGSDYIKILAEIPGPDQATIEALAIAARKYGTITIAHAFEYESTQMAQRGGVDIITHVPMDTAIEFKTAEDMRARCQLSIPTLTKMYGTSQQAPGPSHDYQKAKDSVAALHNAGVPIMAGTDANKRQSGPARVAYGSSIHEEMELLVGAGLSNLEALRAATILPAKYFKMDDRGVIEVGRRADLVLLHGNPIEDIRNTARIWRVWSGGIECEV